MRWAKHGRHMSNNKKEGEARTGLQCRVPSANRSEVAHCCCSRRGESPSRLIMGGHRARKKSVSKEKKHPESVALREACSCAAAQVSRVLMRVSARGSLLISRRGTFALCPPPFPRPAPALPVPRGVPCPVPRAPCRPIPRPNTFQRYEALK
eukprot:SAG31_NODE_1112_length_9855_cov_13.754203_12_plen_152_part_00